MTLALVRSLREPRAPATEEELADVELDVLAGFVLARHSAGLADSTIRGDTNNLESVRRWFGRPLWEMEPRDADRYFGTVLRGMSSATRAGRAQIYTIRGGKVVDAVNQNHMLGFLQQIGVIPTPAAAAAG